MKRTSKVSVVYHTLLNLLMLLEFFFKVLLLEGVIEILFLYLANSLCQLLHVF